MDGMGSPNKVELDKMARQGILDLGAYIPGKSITAVKDEYGLEAVTKLASNECALPLPEKVLHSVREAACNLCRYPDGHCDKLRSRVAALLGVTPDCLLFGNGSEECIRLIGQAFLNPGDTGLIPSPIFDAYDTAIRIPGGQVVRIPLKDFRIDLESILANVDRRTKIIWLCSPSNPFGPIIHREAFEHFLHRLPENILVVLDEAYREFVSSNDAAHAIDYLGKDARVIGLRTFSKAYGLAGLRVGYIVAHPSVTKIISSVKLPFNVNVLAQAAALCMVDEKTFVNHHVAMIREERLLLRKAFEDRGFRVIPSEANFLFVELPIESDALFNQLLSKGFIIRPGSIWGLNRFIRLTVGIREQNEGFLKQLDEALRNH